MLNKDLRYKYLCEKLGEIISLNSEKPSSIDSLAAALGITAQEVSAAIERAEEFGLILCRGEEGVYQPGITGDFLYALYSCGVEEHRISERKRLLEEWIDE